SPCVVIKRGSAKYSSITAPSDLLNRVNFSSWGTSEGWGGVRARKALVQKFFPNDNPPMNGAMP
ncbi:hypothetical protein D0T85_22200, partial [Bacteroides sp. 519]|nr:hypothetical protein [Bacteroides sp. 519]